MRKWKQRLLFSAMEYWFSRTTEKQRVICTWLVNIRPWALKPSLSAVCPDMSRASTAKIDDLPEEQRLLNSSFRLRLTPMRAGEILQHAITALLPSRRTNPRGSTADGKSLETRHVWSHTPANLLKYVLVDFQRCQRISLMHVAISRRVRKTISLPMRVNHIRRLHSCIF